MNTDVIYECKTKHNIFSFLVALVVVFASFSVAFADDEEVTAPVDSAAVTSDVELSNYQFNRDINGLELAPLMVDEYSVLRSVDPNNITPNLSSVNLYNASYLQYGYRDYLPSFITTFQASDWTPEAPHFLYSMLTYDPYVYSKLSNIITNTSNLTNFYNRNHDDLNSFKSQNHTDIVSLQNDINNINWIDWTTINNSVFSDSNATILANSPANYTSPLYFGVAIYQGGYTLIQLPIRSNGIAGSTYSIEFSRLYNGIQPDFYTWSDTQSTYILVGSIPYYSNSTLYVKFTPSTTYYLRGSDVVCKRLDANSADAYKVNQLIAINHIDNDIHDISDDLDKLRRMYASDDELSAKEAQQQYEADALTDFTGSGSASASGSDRNGVKFVQNNLKSGLNTGGSVSDGLGAFSSTSAFWGWFSTDNKSYFDVVIPSAVSPAPLLRAIPDYKKVVWSDDIPDILSDMDYEYYNSLSGGVL